VQPDLSHIPGSDPAVAGWQYAWNYTDKHWAGLGLDRPMDKNLPHFVAGNLATLSVCDEQDE